MKQRHISLEIKGSRDGEAPHTGRLVSRLCFDEAIQLEFVIQSSRDEENFRSLQDFVDSSAAPYGRDAATGHVTATAFVVDRTRNKTLLVRHRKLGRWLPPGGHCDGDSDVRRVALREAREETGLKSLHLIDRRVFDIDIHAIPASVREPEHKHFDVRFLFEADQEEPLAISAESDGLCWIPLHTLTSYTLLPSVLILKEKVLTR
jgi:8-oxo-dGTP pyrophosphatase MutT (NUDIX family)